jgi:hypothetical protein
VSVEAVLAPASFGWVQLQLHYDGRRPPIGLLDDIARLGWSVPPPPSRPASAIDWYTPDPMTGERFTVRPWRAVHDIDPPGRRAARSTWDAGDRAGALRALAPVLVGHQVQVTSPVPELVALATAVRTAGDPTAATPVVPGRAGHLPVVVSFTAPAERLERIDGFLRSTGLSFVAVTELRTRRQVYRGSVAETDVMVVVGEVVVRADRSEALRARLRDEQALAQERPATASTPGVGRPAPGTGPTAAPGAGRCGRTGPRRSPSAWISRGRPRGWSTASSPIRRWPAWA